MAPRDSRRGADRTHLVAGVAWGHCLSGFEDRVDNARVWGRRERLQRSSSPLDHFPLPFTADTFADLTPDVRDGSLEELALAHAEILGWLEGLFQGTQLAIQLQAAQAAQAAQQALMDRGRRRLPSPDPDAPDSRYL